MSVYKRKYRRYEGPFTPQSQRFLVLPRYAFENVFRSRWMTTFFVLCFIPVLIYGSIIYLRYNATFLETFGLRVSDFIAVNADLFASFFLGQVLFSWVLAAFVGPGLISADLANGALPLYFCRPFSRAEYVMGKGSVLFAMISAITWIPGMMLIGLQTAYGGLDWLLANLRIPAALLAGSLIWICVLTLLALALSAWVKWRMVAGALVFAVFIVLGGFAATINGMLGTYWGSLIDLGQVITVIMNYLFLGEQLRGTIPVEAAFGSLTVIVLFSLWLLNRRVQAYEVVR